MQVIEAHEHLAVCVDATGSQHQIDTLLVGRTSVGDWLLTFLNTAREAISEQRARDIQNALAALPAAISGENIDHLFADLLDSEPQLPEFLRNKS